MKDTKKMRIQFTETELRTLLYHIDNELESIFEVVRDLKKRPEEQEDTLNYTREYETLSKVQRKLLRSVTRLTE